MSYCRTSVVLWIVCLYALLGRGTVDGRPNFLLFLVDDLRSDSLGCMGHPFARTPNLDRLSRRGITFDQAFSTSANPQASLAEALTGSRIAWEEGAPEDPSRLVAQEGMIARFAAEGYQVGWLGNGSLMDRAGSEILPSLVSEGAGFQDWLGAGDSFFATATQSPNRPFFLTT
ncbi:MAG: sulfatase-like hydrolase/transferase, partial [Verrucomicrobiota bacterium]